MWIVTTDEKVNKIECAAFEVESGRRYLLQGTREILVVYIDAVGISEDTVLSYYGEAAVSFWEQLADSVVMPDDDDGGLLMLEWLGEAMMLCGMTLTEAE